MSAATAARVALFLPWYRGGGAERVLLLLANALAEHGVAVDLLLGVDEGPYRDEKHPAVNAVVLGDSRVSRCVLPMARWLRREKPAALISSMMYCNCACALANHLAGHPTRHIAREALPAGRELSDKPRRRAFARWCMARADRIVSMNLCMQQDLNEALPGLDRSRQVLIDNAVDFERLHSGAQAAPELLEQLPPQFLLGVGRLSEQKNFPLLIEAWAPIARERNLALVILGEGPDHEALLQQIAGHGLSDLALLPGFDNNPFGWMQRSACLVSSSNYEGMPNVVVQGLLLGTPLVATRCRCGADELIESAGQGRLIECDDRDALQREIEATLDQPPARTPPPEAWQARFRMEHIALKYAELCSPEIHATVASSITNAPISAG